VRTLWPVMVAVVGPALKAAAFCWLVDNDHGYHRLVTT
jgi:hypothetical protein